MLVNERYFSVDLRHVCEYTEKCISQIVLKAGVIWARACVVLADSIQFICISFPAIRLLEK